MSRDLQAYLKAHIEARGPIDIGEYVSIVLGHPEYGYYMRRDPFGVEGDFTTAPEISQMFGEVLGAWAADIWMQMGKPEAFALVECGPGRGTLMADMMRACAGAEGFHAACTIHLLETSRRMRARQAEALKGFLPCWHDGLWSLPEDVPLIVIANEFLDALPFRQLEKTDQGWQERVVDWQKSGLHFNWRPADKKLVKDLPVQDGIFEVSPERENFVRDICARIKDGGQGAALFIDYGHMKSGAGDTFQAVHNHKHVGVFEHIGEADLTSHVDFEALGTVAVREGLKVSMEEQGNFLKALGIEVRAGYLSGKEKEEQKGQAAAALERLVGKDKMGGLFKVMGLSYGDQIRPSGF